MGRPSKILNLPPGMESRPYNQAKQRLPGKTLCELCDKVLDTSLWSIHKNSKKHRAIETAEMAKENAKVNSNGADGYSGESSGFSPEIDSGFDLAPLGTGNDAWTSSTNVDWGSSAGFSVEPSHGNKSRGGGGDRACFGCGEVGHTKRECPKGSSSGDRACFGCGEVGHTKRDCPKGGSGGGGQACFNCGMEGHRKMDCPEPLKPRGGGSDRLCFNCNQPGHNKTECPEPVKPRTGGGGGRACFNCLQPGHNSSDCPEPRVERCRNCDAEGHHSRDCDQPKDWSRVKCTNCSKYGHGAKRCPEPAGGADTYGGGGGDWGNDASSSAAAAAAAGGWDTGSGDTAAAQEPSGNWADDMNATSSW
ncbi:hypothetical protein N0V95_004406 [Ascochyta clinopodiicola]|nr:hypothetical protein N0V95_004406 [Ascochyta clinopodiicola]